MSESVTAGVNGSRESLAAADWAAGEAVLRGVPLRLLHAWEVPPGTEVDPYWAGRILREAGQWLAGRHPEAQIHTEQVSKTPYAALVAASADTRLLALGSRGLGGMNGYLVGDAGMAVVAHASCPVVLVRAGEKQAEDRRSGAAEGAPAAAHRPVVLGVDLRHPDVDLIGFAAEEAARRSAPLHAVHVWRHPAAYGYDAQVLDPAGAAEVEEEQRRELAEAVFPWRDKYPDLTIRETAVAGPVAERLLRFAPEAQLMVLGRRTRRGPIGPRIGSVAHAVLHRAHCPVAVVPHD